MPNQPSGCLGFLFRLFSLLEDLIHGRVEYPWPYAKKDWLLSRAEFSFYRVLQQACGGRYVICPKVGLGDVLYVKKGTGEYQSWRNKIDRKHLDFVLLRPETMTIVAAVELDDASHQGERARERDAVKDKACRDAGLVLLRFAARRSYNVEDVRVKLEQIESMA